MDESSAFKNFINKNVVQSIGKEILEVYPKFPLKNFMKLVPDLDSRELKARVLLVTKHMKESLPADYAETIKILVKVMEKGNLKGFQLWPFSEFIGQFGLEHFDESLKAMYVLTQHFTAEWAVRPYFIKNPVRVLKYFTKWATDKDSHVRRWVSEGSRPLLPWGERLPGFIMDPTPTLLLLEKLKFDEELYVRKSVANHLNDISKNHPTVVIKMIKMWDKDCSENHRPKMDFIRRQALRTLIKKGNKDALKLMGVSGEAEVKISKIKLNQRKYKIGDNLVFEFDLISQGKKNQKLVIDYLIDFIKANGQHSSKVFKLKTIELKPNESVNVKKSHSLRVITTKTYYPGIHHLKIQINGQVLASAEWHFTP